MNFRRTKTYLSCLIHLSFTAFLVSCEAPAGPPPGDSDPALGPVAFTSSLVGRDGCVGTPQVGVGEPLVHLECAGETSQRFGFHAVEGDAATYVLKNASSGLCVGISGGSINSRVEQLSCNAKPSQRFMLKSIAPSADQSFQLMSDSTGKCLANVPTLPAELTQEPCSVRPSQTWRLPDYPGQTPPTDPPPTDPPTDPAPETLPFPDTFPSASDAAIKPIDWTTFTAGRPRDESALRLAKAVLNANKYSLSTWWNKVKNFDAQRGDYLDFGGREEHEIRHPAAVAVGLAVSLKTGIYDPAVVGVPLESAQAHTLKLVSSLAYRHRANKDRGWGGSWQSALWAYKTGFASWLLWDDLGETERKYVKKMLEYEAARFVGYEVPYYRDASGDIVSSGDTKAEENAWNASLLQLAFNMMPEHPHAYAWMHKNIELKASVYATPQDASSDTLLHGRSLKDWLAGSNAYEDGVVINHARVHPDYMAAAVKHNLEAAISASLAGTSTPRAALWNADISYRALVDLAFEEGDVYPGTDIKAQAPGGTVYRDGSGELYYPQGNDWGTDRIIPHVLNDALVGSFGVDTLASQKASYWEALHAQKLLEQQARHSDGRTYASPKEDTYKGREEMVAEFSALAYLSHWLVHQGVFSSSDRAYPLVIDNRDTGFETVSGRWRTHESRPDTLGTSVRYAPKGEGSSKVRYTPKFTEAGDYGVYAWWSCGDDQASNAPYTVLHRDGNTAIRVNQKETCGAWSLLGTFRFEAGSRGYVEQSNDADGTVIADAVLFFR